MAELPSLQRGGSAQSSKKDSRSPNDAERLETDTEERLIYSCSADVELEAVSEALVSVDRRPFQNWRGILVGLGLVLVFVLAATSAAPAFRSSFGRAAQQSGSLVRLQAPGNDELSLQGLDALLQEWQEVQNVSRQDLEEIGQRAKDLKPTARIRDLQSIGYSQNPELLAATRAECVIDTVQAAAYLGRAVVFLYQAINSGQGLRCSKGIAELCAASISGVISSIFWVMSMLSRAASTCAHSINMAALCSADATQILADAAEIARTGAAVGVDCNFDNASRWDNITEGRGYWLNKYTDVTLKEKVDAINTKKLDRQFDESQCAFDVTQAAAYLVRGGLRINDMSKACAEPRLCAVHVLELISAIEWVMQFVSLAVSDCMKGFDQTALCTADITGLIGATVNFCSATTAATVECAHIEASKRRLRIQDDQI
eukprot:TRINITY_DN8609_c0_g3_i1.p1 TRINITY_DN8609_c0_g3~~TRINITY_DN8609_c0_g3_i1.p1  ORF type:complete len:430 (-),score=74.37 TRINITY_DN8609_c0_g3_i1:146-1435(-)